MSRIGKKPLSLPEGVTAEFKDGVITVKGVGGEASQQIDNSLAVVIDNSVITFKPTNLDRDTRAKWGLYRRLVESIVSDVATKDGFSKHFDIVGVGYRAAVKGNILQLNLGYSHDFAVKIPASLTVVAKSQTQVHVSGAKLQVTQFIAKIDALRQDDPYKGKGIYPAGAYRRRKEGKKK